MLVFIILDVYSVHKIPDRFSRQMVGAGMGLLLVAVISTFIFFFSKRIAVPKFVFIAFFAFSFFFMFVFRYFLNKFLRSFVFWRLLLVGKKKICEEIASLINRREFLHSRIVGYLSDDAAPGSSSGFVFMGKIENLARVAKRESIDRIIVASRKIDEDMMRLLLGCMQEKIRVVDCNSLVLLH
ncbi:MAG: hypothetical protein HY752_00260 [Nitrospirae bacterium]|nr:hypothetical protein [Nitrospirota bacterium]